MSNVMRYLANQKRSEMQLSSNTEVLQVDTVNDLPHIKGQADRLGLKYRSEYLARSLTDVLQSCVIEGN